MVDVVDEVIQLNVEYRPTTTDAAAILMQAGSTAYLIFQATQQANGAWRRVGFALVEFPDCLITQFGYPNDEALRGHPLYQHPLPLTYRMYEVRQSSWLRRLEQHNRVVFPQTTAWTGRHFMVVFHDCMFECIAADLQLQVFDEPIDQVVNRVTAELLAE